MFLVRLPGTWLEGRCQVEIFKSYRVLPWLLLLQSPPEIMMTPGQHHNDADEEEVEEAQCQDDCVLPL